MPVGPYEKMWDELTDVQKPKVPEDWKKKQRKGMSSLHLTWQLTKNMCQERCPEINYDVFRQSFGPTCDELLREFKKGLKAAQDAIGALPEGAGEAQRRTAATDALRDLSYEGVSWEMHVQIGRNMCTTIIAEYRQIAQAQAAVQGYSTRLQNQWSWIDGVLNAMNDKVALFDLNQAVSISMNPAEYPYL